MEKILGQGIVTTVGAGLIWLFGAWDIAFQVLIILMIVDYITGVMVGYVTKQLSSQRGVQGIFKKISILITVIVAVAVDRVIGSNMLRMATIFCLVGNEGISLLENLSRLGAPIPDKLVNALLQLKGKGDEDADTNSKER